ncbi:MAG: DUF2058 family protein [Rhodanobacteraceae bacterium]
MSGSLRDELLKSGLAKPRPSRSKSKRMPSRKLAENKSLREPGDGQELDLAKAYALRARSEAREREQARREAERKKREKQARRRKLRELLEGKVLDTDSADCVRHYEFHGKIRRVHVTRSQLAQLNTGQLAVLQAGGRFLLVEADVARAAAEIEPGCLALLVDPEQAGDADDGVPDDLVW